MDKNKKKRSSHGRKKRLQLDDDSYSRNSSTDGQTSSSSTASTSTQSVAASTRSAAASRRSAMRNVATALSSTSSQPATSTSSGSTTTADFSIATDVDQNAPQPSIEQRLNDSSEGGAVASSPPRSGSSSPDPNCAICLGKLENKSFTDSCFHQFCFVCLVEWSKVKAECPLCKQSFKSIVHNVRSYEDYDQYHIPRPEERNVLHELAVPGGIRFRYRTTVTDHRYAHLAERINREIESRLLQRPSRSVPIPNYRRLRQPANSDFRRSVYLQRLKLNSQQLSTRRRVRETSPSFYHENPAQTHRLVPWVNRELNALLQGHGEQMAFVLDLIMGLIKRFAIDSEEFYQHVLPYIGRHTRQFMHEFMMFAKSPYHMAAYDRHSTYDRSDEPHHDSDSDNRGAEGSDNNVIVVSPGNSPLSEDRNSQTPRREDSGFDSWERSMLTECNPYMTAGLAPIVRTFRNEDLPSMNPFIGLRSDYASTSASGWDSPTPGSSQIICRISPIKVCGRSSGTTSHTTGDSIWMPSSRSFSAPNMLPLPQSHSISSLFGNLNMPRLPPTSTQTLPSILQEDHIEFPQIESSSDGSDIEIVEVEKPWNERSPIQLSSGEDTDFDVMIMGTTHIDDPVKVEKKKKHKQQHEESRFEHGKRKRSRDSSRERHSKRKHNKSKSYNSQSRSRSRSRSLSPLRLTIFRSPDYQHKKFAYKAHGDTPNEMFQNQTSRSNIRSTRRSWSLSSSESDTESHVSITSRRHSSKSKHASIEIVEYRKKSSKSKKSKKHKKDKGHDKVAESDKEHDSKHHKKGKKHTKSSDNENKSRKRVKSGHSSSSCHTKHRQKSKKKKHQNEKTIDGEISSEEYKMSAKTASAEDAKMKNNKRRKHDVNILSIYTSDSESDSSGEIDVELVQHEEEVSHSELKSTSILTPGVEFVEIDATQAAVLDQELDSISKTLASNDYINSLMTGDNVSQRQNVDKFENDDPNKMVNPNEVFHHRSFKKHPYGHKKSSKSASQNSLAINVSNPQTVVTESMSVPTSIADGASEAVKPEDNIQSHDISSCSDIDFERQLPSFLTFSNRNPYIFDVCQETSSLLDRHDYMETNVFSKTSEFEKKKRSPVATAAYESPTSTELLNGRENKKLIDACNREQYIVDVDTISEDSDVDITGINVPLEPSTILSYRPSCNSIGLSNVESLIDVVGDSDEEVNDDHIRDTCLTAGRNAGETNSLVVCLEDTSIDRMPSENVSEIDVENEDSDIECSLVETHKTFEIDEDSDDSDAVEHLNTYSNDIDILCHSDDEIVIEDGDQEIDPGRDIDVKRTLTIDIDSNSDTDLDYNCDDLDITSPMAESQETANANSELTESSDSESDEFETPDEVVNLSPKNETGDIDTEGIDTSTETELIDTSSENVYDISTNESTSCENERSKRLNAPEDAINSDVCSENDEELCSENDEELCSENDEELCSENDEEQSVDQHVISEQTAETPHTQEPTEQIKSQNPVHNFTTTTIPVPVISGIRSSFTWTSNPIFEASTLSNAASSDSRLIGTMPLPVAVSSDTGSRLSGFTGRERSAPERDYIINLPRDRTLSWELASPDSLTSITPPLEWLDRPYSPNSHDGDFLPED